MSNFYPEMTPKLWDAFEDFLSYIKIDSKETGGAAPLELYQAQRMASEAIRDGLTEDIHFFVFLKARQLGITTLMLCLDIFWVSVFPGIQGAIIFDTDDNKESFRTLIERMLESLPASHKIPVVKNNRVGIVLRNGSVLSYLVAGRRANKGLGRSKGLNFVHATEVAFWGDPEAVEALTKTLAQKFAARLFVFESTAKGFNLFNRMWRDAKADDLNKRAVFIGWWAKEDYAVEPGSKMMLRYGSAAPSAEEAEKIAIVREEYNFEVSMEQLAWYRHQKDPDADPESLDVDTPSDSILEQEYPWHEEEAFIATGSAFFHTKDIADAYKKAIDRKFKGYRYLLGEDFFGIKIEQVKTARLSQLKVWAEPEDDATYVIGADPAYGSSDTGDRYCVQVLRVWADGWEQVAEFCVTFLKTYQFAWVVAHLCGVYKNARLLLELNGPGDAVFNELRNMQTMAQAGLLKDSEGKQGFFDIFGNTRTYLYHRLDSIASGYSYHWKTTGQNKSSIMNQLRDSFSLGMGVVNSVETIDEMKTIVQEGDSIKGEGSTKDDRVIALALAQRAWTDGERKRLQNSGRTREMEEKKKTATYVDIENMWARGVVADFFSRQVAQRERANRMERRKRWK